MREHRLAYWGNRFPRHGDGHGGRRCAGVPFTEPSPALLGFLHGADAQHHCVNMTEVRRARCLRRLITRFCHAGYALFVCGVVADAGALARCALASCTRRPVRGSLDLPGLRVQPVLRPNVRTSSSPLKGFLNSHHRKGGRASELTWWCGRWGGAR
jgi:hypothetical protein